MSRAMWIDETGAVHTVWVPPPDILGEDAVSALRALPQGVRSAALEELDARFDDVLAAVTRDGTAGPRDLGDAEDPAGDASTSPPPLLPGLAIMPGVAAAATVLSWLDHVVPRWRMEALEAVVEVLEGQS